MQAEQQSERERFEAWCKENYLCSDYSFERSSDGYAHAVSHRVLRGCHANVQMLWEAFRDARAALSRQSPQGWKRCEACNGKGDSASGMTACGGCDGSGRVAAPQPPAQGGSDA